jgi:hypothetical protein
VFSLSLTLATRRGDYLFMEAGEISTENAAPPPLEETFVDIPVRANLSPW